jgi:archaellum component FlaC
MAATPITQRQADEQITRLIVLTEGIQKRVEKIDAIEDKQDKFALDLTRFGIKCESIFEAVNVIKTEIYGNGKSGLKDDVSHLKSRMKVITWAASIIGSSLLIFSTSLFIYLIAKYGSMP